MEQRQQLAKLVRRSWLPVSGVANATRQMMTAVIVLAVFTASPYPAHAVQILNKDWRQLTETVNVSWREVDAICGNRIFCEGSIRGTTFDGWRWASLEDVRQLFNFLIEPDRQNYPFPDTETARFRRGNHPDIDAFFDLFDPTDVYYYPGSDSWEVLFGLTSSFDGPYLLGDHRPAGMENYVPYNPPGSFYCLACIDAAYIAIRSSDFDYTSPINGVWLYRLVPEPGSLALLGLGLFGLGISRRRGSLVFAANFPGRNRVFCGRGGDVTPASD